MTNSFRQMLGISLEGRIFRDNDTRRPYIVHDISEEDGGLIVGSYVSVVPGKTGKLKLKQGVRVTKALSSAFDDEYITDRRHLETLRTEKPSEVKTHSTRGSVRPEEVWNGPRGQSNINYVDETSP